MRQFNMSIHIGYWLDGKVTVLSYVDPDQDDVGGVVEIYSDYTKLTQDLPRFYLSLFNLPKNHIEYFFIIVIE